MLETILAQEAAGFAPIHIGKPNIEKNKVGVLAFDGGEGLSGAVSDVRFKLFMKSKLLRQRKRKVLIIVDDRICACCS